MGDRSILALLPDELPLTYRSVPTEEQAWRGRLLPTVWIPYRDEALSWWAALARDHQWGAGMRRTVSETTDEYLAEAFAVAWEERRHR